MPAARLNRAAVKLAKGSWYPSMLVKARTIDARKEKRIRYSLLIAFACLVSACILAAQVASGADSSKAQLTGDYCILPMDGYDNAAKVRDLEVAARMCWVDGSIIESSDAFKKFQEYYTRYLPRKMSQPQAGAELNDIIYSTLKGLESTARAGSPTMKQKAQPMIRDVMVTIATRQVQGKFFNPTARINATLLLANLNSAPAEGGRPPQPDTSREVAGTLATLYRTAEVPTGVRLVALGGLRRQAVLLGQGAPGSFKTFLLDQGKSLLEGKGPAGLAQADLPQDVFAFVQRYAVDMVASVGGDDDKKWLVEQLKAIVTDEKTSPIIANYAARQLGTLTAQLKATTPNSQTLVAWAERTHHTLLNEIERLKAQVPPAVSIPQRVFIQTQGNNGGMMGGGMMGGYGGSEGMGSYGGSEGMGSYGGSEGMGSYGGGEGMGGRGGMMGGLGGGEGMGGMDGYGGMGGYGMGGMTGVKQEPDLLASRRLINAHLEAHLRSMAGGVDTTSPEGGMLLAIADEDKELAEELAANLVSMVEEINMPANGTKQRYMFVLEDQARSLKKWIDRNKTDDEPEEPAANPGGDVAGGDAGNSGQVGG